MTSFENYVHNEFNGLLDVGRHSENAKVACILEAYSKYLGVKWTDKAEDLNCFDITSLNDGNWFNNRERGKYMPQVMEAIEGSLDWPQEDQTMFLELLFIKTIRELLPRIGYTFDHTVLTLRDAHKTLQEIGKLERKNAAICDLSYAYVNLCHTDSKRTAKRIASAHHYMSYIELSILIKACHIWVQAAEEARQ